MVKATEKKNDPTAVVLRILTGKWKVCVLYNLSREGTMRFSELKKAIPDVTQRMLTKQLRELEDDNIISRKVYPVVPPKVEYSLTDIGQHLKPILESLQKWGKCYLKKQKNG